MKNLIKSVHHAVKRAVTAAVDWIKEVWEHHQTLMDDEPAYRAQIIAAGQAILTLLRAPRTLTTGLLAALRLYAAAYGHHPRWTDDGWDRYR